MSGNSKILTIFVLLSAIILSGCNYFKKNKTSEIPTTSVEQEKRELLRQIDKKFENPDAHYKLGRLYQADGLWTKAETEYNAALSFNPAYKKAQAGIVKVLLESGDKNKAELAADIYMSQASHSAEGSLQLAIAFQKQFLDDYAMLCYRQALRLAPNSAKINKQIGYYYLSKGDRDRARDYLSRSFDLNPNQPEVSGELGRLGIEVKRPTVPRTSGKKLDKIADESIKESE